jgi:hypothetical protein
LVCFGRGRVEGDAEDLRLEGPSKPGVTAEERLKPKAVDADDSADDRDSDDDSDSDGTR